MKVKIFDEEYEKDLENDINEFLSDFEGDIIEIKYQVALGIFSEEQIYCFSAMIIYTNWFNKILFCVIIIIQGEKYEKR